MADINIVVRSLKPFSEYEKCSANAAVSIILLRFESEVYLLIVKRVESSRDPWSGHFALPGGKRETCDRDLLETAIRETAEETGIDLKKGIFLGVAEPEKPSLNPSISILPFAFLLKDKPVIRLNKRELESYVWIPINLLLKSEKIIEIESKKQPAFVVKDVVIWGITYRILKKVFESA